MFNTLFFQSETKYIIDISEKTHYFLFLVVFTIILPVISMLLLLKNKKISSLELYDKSERSCPNITYFILHVDLFLFVKIY